MSSDSVITQGVENIWEEIPTRGQAPEDPPRKDRQDTVTTGRPNKWIGCTETAPVPTQP